MTGILIRSGEFGHTQRERRPCDNGDRDWRDQGHLGSRQGMPRIADYHQKLGTDKGGSLEGVLGPLEGAEPCWHVDLRLLVFRTVRE